MKFISSLLLAGILLPASAFARTGVGEGVVPAPGNEYSYPKAPENAVLTVLDTYGNVRVTWDEVTADEEGKEFSGGSVTYSVYTLEGYRRTLVEGGLKQLKLDFQPVKPGSQKFVQCLVFAYFNGQESDGAITELLPVGTPYDEISEDFSSSPSAYGWAVDSYGYVNVAIADKSTTGIPGSDGNDDRYLAMSGRESEGDARLFSGLVSLEKVKTPVLSLQTYNNMAPGEENRNIINVYAREMSDAEPALIFTGRLDELAEGDSWGRVEIPMLQYSGKVIQFIVEGELHSSSLVLIDDLQLETFCEFDLALTSISAPETAECDTSFEITVDVANIGRETAYTYFVELYADDHLVETAEMHDLEPFCNQSVIFNRHMSGVQTEPVSYRAELLWYPDEDVDNNRSETKVVSPLPRVLPAPRNLYAENPGKVVLLTWDAPDINNADAQQPLVVEGYNVYRDMVRVNDSIIKETAFTDENLVDDTVYTYMVTAVYADLGESLPSAEFAIEYSGIEALFSEFDDGRMQVFTIDGSYVHTDSLSDLQPGVYILRTSRGISKIYIKRP